MKTDTRIVISINKQFYSYNDEIIIHIFFNKKIIHHTILTVTSPTGIEVSSAFVDSFENTTETFTLICGGPKMNENGYYIIRVQGIDVTSEVMFEYYKKGNQNPFSNDYR